MIAWMVTDMSDKVIHVDPGVFSLIENMAGNTDGAAAVIDIITDLSLTKRNGVESLSNRRGQFINVNKGKQTLKQYRRKDDIQRRGRQENKPKNIKKD